MTRIAADDGTGTATPKDGIVMVMSDVLGKENKIGGQKMLIESMDEKEKETEIIRTDTVNATVS